jgi:hypothetical protein
VKAPPRAVVASWLEALLICWPLVLIALAFTGFAVWFAVELLRLVFA